MPNSIKIAEGGSIANALSAGNMYFGVGDHDLGPTSSSGFYNGINPPSGGYTIYLNKSGGPSITCPSNDADLIAQTQTISGESMANVNACFAYFASQSDKMVMHNPINGLITDSLVAYFAPGIIPSYPRSGTTMYDLGSERHNASLENGGTFNSHGWLNLDGVDDEITLSGADDLIQQKTTITLCILFRMETLGSLKGLLGCLNYGCTQNLGLVASNANLQFYNDTTTCMNTATAIVETGKWIYAVGTYDGTTTKIRGFKGGAMQSGQTDLKSGATNSFTSEFQVFGAKHSNFFTDGDVARASVYQKVLTEAEILTNYHQAAIITDSLVFAIDAGNLMSYTPDNTDDTQCLVSSTVSTLTNGVGFNSSNGGFWEFDGVDDEIIVPGGTSSNYNWGNTDSFSMETWVQIVSMPASGNTMGIFVKAYKVGIDLYFPTVNTMVFRCGTRNSQQSIVSQTGGYTPLGVWSHVVFTYEPDSSTGVKLYINGEFNNSISNTSQDDFSNNTNYTIGGNEAAAGTPRFGNIRTSTARMYNKTLSASEIKQNYNANINKFN